MQYSDVSALFKTLKKKTGLDVHPHLLRHTHATTYYQSTKDIKQVQERLGHAQIQTTINIYLHPSDKEVRDNWKKAEQSFAVPEAKNEY
jgi:integrase